MVLRKKPKYLASKIGTVSSYCKAEDLVVNINTDMVATAMAYLQVWKYH